MGRKLQEPNELFDSDESDDTLSWLDTEPVPTRRTSGQKAPAPNHRRAIEDLHEERALRRLLRELDYDFGDDS